MVVNRDFSYNGSIRRSFAENINGGTDPDGFLFDRKYISLYQMETIFYNRKGIKGYETCGKNYDIEKAARLVTGRTGAAAFCIPAVRIEMGEWCFPNKKILRNSPCLPACKQKNIATRLRDTT